MKLPGTRAVVFAILVTAVGAPAIVQADGGMLRVRQEAGPFIVSIFTAPEPLRAGWVDVSVIVQSSAGRVLTDAVVDMQFESATQPIERRRVMGTQDAATNKLAYAAVVELPTAGQWRLTVSVVANGSAATVTCALPVGAPRSQLGIIWPWLLLPPVGIALFAAHQTLKQQRLSAHE